MPDAESPLTAGERLVIAAFYARLTLSQNRTHAGRLAVESPCYADLNICVPETLSHKKIPAIRLSEGIETC
ncbi:hypothetical protein P5V34_04305 [Mycobacteroides abscessus subsp. abscessus]|uniref:hypothetical protein n=1 Tax=Mycobacteroides abscessus TaxID=36809 RepID=UPI00266BAD2A|nr:hypothetical protein [Mycobacteroides abscessus]MDO3013208.1 hypothetical protein [Mycobacteroides abscessus subsp. abscessus]